MSDVRPLLTVWYGKMPESNGRENWTATIRRVNPTDKWGQEFCFARSEYPDRVRYEADRMRWIIGELAERPDILAYDADLHSGYVAPVAASTVQPSAGAEPVAWRYLAPIGGWAYVTTPNRPCTDAEPLYTHPAPVQPDSGGVVAVVQAEYDHWIKEALKHKRPNGLRSDHAQADLERAKVAKRILDKLAALAPIAAEGGEKDKLRIAVEALEKIKLQRDVGLGTQSIAVGALQALSALRTEPSSNAT